MVSFRVWLITLAVLLTATIQGLKFAAKIAFPSWIGPVHGGYPSLRYWNRSRFREHRFTGFWRNWRHEFVGGRILLFHNCSIPPPLTSVIAPQLRHGGGVHQSSCGAGTAFIAKACSLKSSSSKVLVSFWCRLI